MNINDLKAYISSRVYANNKKAVTATKVLEALLQIVDDCYGNGGGGGTITTDAIPAQGSSNPVQSGGVFSALLNKVDKDAIDAILNSVSLANHLITADVNLPLNGYISQSTHQFVETGDTYKCSGFVFVKGFSKIDFSARAYTEDSDACQMVFFDADKQPITSLDIQVNDGITQTIDLTDDEYADVCYAVLSGYQPGWSGSRTYMRVSGEYDFTEFLKKDMVKLKTGYNIFNIDDIQMGMGISSTGSYASDPQAITSGLMELPEDRGRNGDLFLFNLPATTYSKRFIYYDEDMNVVAGPSDIAAANTSAQIGCRSDAKYFRFTLIRATMPLPSEEDVAEMFADTVVTFQYSMTDPQPYYKNIESINGVGLCASNISNLYKGKKWVCVGDSLTERNSHSTKFYHDFIKEWLGFEVVNMGVSGTGYKTRDDVQSPTTEGAFYQRVTQIPSDADVVTIFGSFNDMTQSHTLGTPSDTGTTTICGCINATIEAIYAINPAMKLGIIAPCPWKEMNPSNADAVAYVEALETICKNNSIPFLNLFYESGLRPWKRAVRDLVYDRDAQTSGDYHGTHPNAIGHEMIASKTKVFIQSLI